MPAVNLFFLQIYTFDDNDNDDDDDDDNNNNDLHDVINELRKS